MTSYQSRIRPGDTSLTATIRRTERRQARQELRQKARRNNVRNRIGIIVGSAMIAAGVAGVVAIDNPDKTGPVFRDPVPCIVGDTGIMTCASPVASPAPVATQSPEPTSEIDTITTLPGTGSGETAGERR